MKMENEKVIKEKVEKEEITDEAANDASGGYFARRKVCATKGCNNYVIGFAAYCPLRERKIKK